MNLTPTLVDNGQNILIHIPMTFKKRGGRKEIIVPDGLADSALPKAPAQDALVMALVRAHKWQEIIDSGKVGTASELAKKVTADRSYVSRILRLTLLAPDIVEAILQGREPSGLSLAKLTRTLPLLWDEQRVQFGF